MAEFEMDLKVGDRVLIEDPNFPSWNGTGTVKNYVDGIYNVYSDARKAHGAYYRHHLTLIESKVEEEGDRLMTLIEEYVEGDLVFASKGENVIEGRIVRSGSGNLVIRITPSASATIHELKLSGYRFGLIEKAAPLPVEPGYYIAHDHMTENDFVVRISEEGANIEFPNGSTWSKLGNPERFHPYRALI